MILVTLYSRSDCHLCDQTHQDLNELQSEIPHQLKIIDVDSDPKLAKEFGFEVPVVEVGPFKLRSPFTIQELKITLLAARDRERHIQMVKSSPKLLEVREKGVWRKSDSFSRWFSNHYMIIFNLAVFMYLAGALLAPVLMKIGLETPAGMIYKAYSLVCHQLGFRSFYLFGDQAVYPRTAAGITNLLTFNQATGLSESSTVSDLFKARAYVGDHSHGYKIALCERDLAIYAGILIFGLLFSLTRYRIPALPWYLWILLAVIPIALDGFSQLLSQPPLSFLPFRESTPQLRVLTGFLFGFGTAWFGFPVVEESMKEMRNIYQDKWERLNPSS